MKTVKENNVKDAVAGQEFDLLMRQKAIEMAVDIKALFELYAYRVIDHQQYIEQVYRLNLEYAKTIHDMERKFKDQFGTFKENIK